MRLIHSAVRMEYLGPVAKGALMLPMMATRICAGFPSPADDWIEDDIDLQRLLGTNKTATFLWRVAGHSMRDVGIFDGDVVIVDRSQEPREGDAAVVFVNGEVSLKLLRGGRFVIANAAMPIWPIHEADEIEVWGKVTHCIHVPRA